MFLAAASLALLLSQAPVTSPAKCGDISTVDAFGPETAAKARRFLVELQSAVAHDKRDEVASLVQYPLRAQLKGHPALIRTRSSFLANYAAIFTSSIKSAIANQSATCLSYASSGYTPDNGSSVSFEIGESGEVWFNSKTDAGPLKITTINNTDR